jgi:hypothetical protein
MVLPHRTPVDGLAEWSAWLPFAQACAAAPRQPGVYLAREGLDGPIVYAGMAGERHGQGIRGRLNVYSSGKALVSGLGEAVMDRALADTDWLRERLTDVQEGRPMRAKAWGQAALARANLYVCWAITVNRRSAFELERAVLHELGGGELWNRSHPANWT